MERVTGGMLKSTHASESYCAIVYSPTECFLFLLNHFIKKKYLVQFDPTYEMYIDLIITIKVIYVYMYI